MNENKHIRIVFGMNEWTPLFVFPILYVIMWVIFLHLPFLCSYLYFQPVSQFSHSVVSDSLQPLGLQHTRSPCPSPIPGVYSNSCPLSQWCHPTISSSVILFSYHLQFFPASGSFQMNNIFACIRWPKYWSFSFSISPSKEYPGLISFRMDWLDLLAVQGTLKSLLHSLACCIF